MTIQALVLLMLVLSTSPGVAGAARPVTADTTRVGVPTAVEEVRTFEHGGRSYYLIYADLSRTAVRVHWKDEAGVPYGRPSALARRLDAGRTIAVLNGGIFRSVTRGGTEEMEPMGLLVQEGRRVLPLDLTPRPREPSNFHDHSAVLAIMRDGTARIVPRETAAGAVPRMREAMQSGPQLVVRGRSRASSYRGRPMPRTAVGVCGPRLLVFAVSRGDATLGDVARLFHQGLRCPDVLFLDGGGIRGLVVPADTIRVEHSAHGAFAGLISIERRR